MVGMLAPEYEEVVTGDAEVREIFRVPKQGAIAGCLVQNGVITHGSKVRFIRDGTIIWKGAVQSLRRFKDDAQEVHAGFECGIGLSDFQAPQAGRCHRDLRRPRGRSHPELSRVHRYAALRLAARCRKATRAHRALRSAHSISTQQGCCRPVLVSARGSLIATVALAR